jgi:hypothetical protein
MKVDENIFQMDTVFSLAKAGVAVVASTDCENHGHAGGG